MRGPYDVAGSGGGHGIDTVVQDVARRYTSDGPLARDGLPRPPLASFGHGAAGVAYFLLRYSSFGEDPGALDAAAGWIALAERQVDGDGAFLAESSVFPSPRFELRPSLYFGEAGVWCVAALVAASRDDPEGVARAVDRFAALVPGCPDTYLDVMFGAAGLLLGASVLTERLGGDRLVQLGERLADRMTAAVVARRPPGPSDLEWLGAAHGWAGVAHALLRWCQATETPPHPALVDLLDRLATAETAYGQWPRRDDLPEVWAGWCHGSAGWAQLWTLAWEVLARDDLLTRAERAAAYAVYDQGGGAGMCCGQVGEAYAALAVFGATDDRAWLAQARKLAAEVGRTPASDQFPEHSLWRGDLGAALLLSEVEDPMRAAMPLYRILS